MSVDPVTASSVNGTNFNRYWYGNNNSYRFTDPDGRWAEDLLIGVPSLVVGAISLKENISEGNVGSALLDVVGIAADVAAIATPAVPGGAGLAIKAGRGADNAISAVRGAEAAADGKRASTLTPGPHAGESIPVDGPGRANASQQAETNRIGQETGCHTCGATTPGTSSGNHVMDHQPPSSLNPPGGEQRGYPHCIDCSRRQGGEVNPERRRRERE